MLCKKKNKLKCQIAFEGRKYIIKSNIKFLNSIKPPFFLQSMWSVDAAYNVVLLKKRAIYSVITHKIILL